MTNINVPIDTRSLDEIYEAAKNETGPLIVAAGGDAQAQWDPVRTAWKNRFPDIELNLTVDFSKYHDGRADRAYAIGEHYSDIIFLQALQDYRRWKSEGRLLFYKPPNHEAVYSSHKDLDGAYYGISIWSFGKMLYDNTRISEADMPQSWADLLDPKYKDKLVLTYPNDDDAVNYLFEIIVGQYGWEWLEALKQQNVQWVRGTATTGYILVEGKNASKAQGHYRPKEYVADNDQRVLSFTTAGYPPGDSSLSWYTMPAPNQFMSWVETAAIFKSTPRPNTAKLFMAWATGDEFQQWLSANGTLPTILKTLNKQNGVPSLDDSDVTQLNGYRVATNDRTNVDRLMKQYEMTLGTPQGVSPMDVYGFDDVRAL